MWIKKELTVPSIWWIVVNEALFYWLQLYFNDVSQQIYRKRNFSYE